MNQDQSGGTLTARMQKSGQLWQALLAASPLLLSPAFVYALAEGIFNLGGGEKDILLALPWLIWSVVFAVTGWLLIIKRWPVVRWVRRSALLATMTLFVLAAIAYTTSSLGIA